MGEAQLVADCVKAMRDVVDIPVTVKHVLASTTKIVINFYVILLIPSAVIITAIPLLFMLAKLGYRD